MFRRSFVALAKVIAAVILIASLSACEIIRDGQRGVETRFGKVAPKMLEPGTYLNVPLVREVQPWDIKTMKLDRDFQIPSREGLIVGLNVTLLYRVDDAVKVRIDTGLDYASKVLEPTLNNSFRETLAQADIQDIITNQKALSENVRSILEQGISGRGITIESLLVTNLTLPTGFKESIEKKLQQQQKNIQKDFEIEQAKKDAQIEIERSRGAAESQTIIRSSLSPDYLHYLWINTLNQNPNVIYVATEANMPMFRTTPDKDKAAPAAQSTQPANK